MSWRLILFLLLCFFGTWLLAENTPLQIDGFLAGISVSLFLVLALFAHYRYIGTLRSSGEFQAALRQLLLWKWILPSQAYHQIRLQILSESNFTERALEELNRAEEKELLEPAFIYGFRAEVHRRLAQYTTAENLLIKAIDQTPPGVLRAGLLSQLAHLYATKPKVKAQELERAEKLLDEAEEYSLSEHHRNLIQAVRGEISLAKKNYRSAEKQLSSALKKLLDTANLSTFRTEKPKSFFEKLLAGLWELFFGDDGHQYPLYAEFLISLGLAQKSLGELETAEKTFRTAEQLSSQPFVLEQLKSSRT